MSIHKAIDENPDYKAVSLALEKAHDSVHRVSILSASHPLPDGSLVLVEGSDIFLPKKVLLGAIPAARNIFFSSSTTAEEKFSATSVLLLLDGKHDTAANYRKRYALSSNSVQRKLEIEQDACFMESILRSPLRKHTKSETLWAHRRWLLKTAAAQPDLECEIEIVIAAAETHPRNVYAWDHLRWLIMYWGHLAPLQEGRTEYDISEGVPNTMSALSYTWLQSKFLLWCSNHPSDTSGWSFLYWLITAKEVADMMGSDELHKVQTLSQQRVYNDVLSCATRLKLKNESLWSFLRALSSSKIGNDTARDRFRHSLAQVFPPGLEDRRSHAMKDLEVWLQVPRVTPALP